MVVQDTLKFLFLELNGTELVTVSWRVGDSLICRPLRVRRRPQIRELQGVCAGHQRGLVLTARRGGVRQHEV